MTMKEKTIIFTNITCSFYADYRYNSNTNTRRCIDIMELEVLHAIYHDIQGISVRFREMDLKLQNVTDQLNRVESSLHNIYGKVEDMELTIENVINKNIQLIAEGHLDISRRLDSALMVENEKELLLIRVNELEDEIRRVKDKIEDIA